MKTRTLDQLFTAAELNKAIELYEQCRKTGERFNKRCAAEIVEPALARINKTTGQENDASYLAYGIEYALMKGN
jgi:hypothetical protein